MNAKKKLGSRIRGWFPQEPSSIILPHRTKLTNMRKPKYSKMNIALFFFVSILLLSVFAQIAFQADIPSKYYPQYYIRAENLTVKPENYFILPNPDQYVLKAINGERVVISQTETQIYDLERQHNTSNVEYNGSYYTIGIAFVDSFPPLTLPYILAGFAISIIGIAIVVIYRAMRKFKPLH